MYALLVVFSLAVNLSGPKFIEDDYARALKQARAQKKMLFVDAWAPWCHTCLSMKEQVFSRPAFTAFEKHLVFASVDTEKAKSADFLTKFPVDVWPTLLFIDPLTEKVVFRWLGSADEVQMQAIFEAAQAKTGSGREADEALAARHTGIAAEKYQTVIEGGDATNARTVLSMLSALSLAGRSEACARTAMEQLPLFTSSQERVAALTWGLPCAVAMADGKTKTTLVDGLAREGTKALNLEGVLPDDTSGLYEVLVAEREAAHDDVAVQKLATQWLTFLEQQAAKAPNPSTRVVFDPHRVSAALASKQAAKMVQPLLQSEKEFPKDYNSPARLAVVYGELGQIDEGLRAIDRALIKCTEGPRRIRLYETKMMLLGKKGDAAGRKKVLEEAVRYARKLPRGQFDAKRVEALEAQLQSQ